MDPGAGARQRRQPAQGRAGAGTHRPGPRPAPGTARAPRPDPRREPRPGRLEVPGPYCHPPAALRPHRLPARRRPRRSLRRDPAPRRAEHHGCRVGPGGRRRRGGPERGRPAVRGCRLVGRRGRGRCPCLGPGGGLPFGYELAGFQLLAGLVLLPRHLRHSGSGPPQMPVRAASMPFSLRGGHARRAGRRHRTGRSPGRPHRAQPSLRRDHLAAHRSLLHAC